MKLFIETLEIKGVYADYSNIGKINTLILSGLLAAAMGKAKDMVNEKLSNGIPLQDTYFNVLKISQADIKFFPGYLQASFAPDFI